MKNLFLLLVCIAFSSFALASSTYSGALHPMDSIGVENKGGVWFILHKVEKGETLSALARRYKQSVSAIQNANPEVKGGLSLGAIIKIPAPHLANKKALNPKPTSSTNAKMHTVTAGEGLFAIARKYNVSVNDILEWNNLSKDDALKAGQVLKVSKTAASDTKPSEPKQIPVIPSPNKPAKVENSSSTPNKTEPKAEVKPSQVDLSNAGFEKVVERGIAEVIEEQKPSRMHLCLHKTAPEGTIIQVKNEQNGNTVFVRVIGKLPETAENDRVVLKLSKKAFESLQALNKRFAVEISYNKADGDK